MTAPRAVTVTVCFPPGGGGAPWRLRISGAGKQTLVERVSEVPPAGHGRRRFRLADEADGICLSLTERCAAGEALPSGVEAGHGLYRAIVVAVRDPVARRQLREVE